MGLSKNSFMSVTLSLDFAMSVKPKNAENVSAASAKCACPHRERSDHFTQTGANDYEI